MSGPQLALRVTSTVDQLPLDRTCDLELELVLTNRGRKAIEIYPNAAKLAAIASYAGIGITWAIALIPAGSETPLPLLELRRWYGPPGNPPSPAYAKQQAVSLAAGEEHVAHLVACWIPNAHLSPDHLAPAVLDPEGMDNVAPRSWTPPPGYPMPPPLVESFPLAQASVLVFNATAPAIEAAMRDKPDFLRGHVVAFVPGAGAYELHAGYQQSSWMGLGSTFDVRATPLRLVVGV